MAQGKARTDDEIVTEVRDHYEQGVDYLREYHVEFTDNYRFLFKQEHYDDRNANERDRRRLKPKGRQLFSKVRHVVAQTVKQLRGLSTRPVDSDTDPETAEAARFLMEYETKDTRKGLKLKLYRAVQLAVGAGMGVLWLDVRYDLGPYPEVRPRLGDPRNLFWTPGWQDPEDDTCPYVGEVCWMDKAAIERMKGYGWKNTDGLTEEGTATTASSGARPNPLQPVTALSNAGPNPGAVRATGLIRVIKLWYRFSDDYEAPTPGDTTKLAAADRYMACPTCGYKDRSQKGSGLPEQGGFCPVCHAAGVEQPMSRVDVEANTSASGGNGSGRRLCIVAPEQKKLFFKGPWPYDINGKPMRNVPVATFRRYELPLEPWPMSETTLDWSLQVMSNAGFRRGYEYVSRAGAVIIVGGGGLMDATGKKPFEFTDKPLSLARYMGMGAPPVETFQPRNLLSDLLPYQSALEAMFRTDMGISDLGLTPERSKDIAVGTVRQLTQTGEIPVDDFAERCADSLSNLYSVWYDMKRAIMTERQWIGLQGPDGAVTFEQMRGEDMPNADVIVECAPNWSEFDIQRLTQFREILTAIQTPPGLTPEALAGLMRISNVPPSIARDFQTMAAKMEAPPPLPPGVPGGAGGPPPGIPMPPPPSSAGMVPA